MYLVQVRVVFYPGTYCFTALRTEAKFPGTCTRYCHHNNKRLSFILLATIFIAYGSKTLLQIAQRRHRRRHHFSAPPPLPPTPRSRAVSTSSSLRSSLSLCTSS